LIDADQLARACASCSASREKSLPDVLCDEGWLLPQDRGHLDHLVDRRLARFGGDARASFAALPGDVRGVLAGAVAAGAGGEASSWYLGPRYALNRLHAVGGIGEVWLARDVDLQREVAVKRLQRPVAASEAARARFLREAMITGQLDHPGVVPIYEMSLGADGRPYYSMRFVRGETLANAVRAHHLRRVAGGSDPGTFLGLLGAFCVVCNTIAYAHAKGIVHRDLKCGNVILGDYGEVVVIDWGLAKVLGGGETAEERGPDGQPLAVCANPTLTVAGHGFGTPSYAAPEQAAGLVALIGPATDVYGLCAILYEILTGQPPFVGDDPQEVMRRVQQQEPARPSELVPGVPEALERICLTGLAKSQASRHPSADSLARAVQSWVSDLAQRRQAEDERERFFALSLDLLAILEGGRFRQVSPAWERHLGH
jgi:serine/threonine protein kinase